MESAREGRGVHADLRQHFRREYSALGGGRGGAKFSVFSRTRLRTIGEWTRGRRGLRASKLGLFSLSLSLAALGRTEAAHEFARGADYGCAMHLVGPAAILVETRLAPRRLCKYGNPRWRIDPSIRYDSFTRCSRVRIRISHTRARS